MMNVLQIQDKLKNFSQEQLIGEMQSPSGNAPQFLVLSEITRRQKMVNDDKIRQAKQNEMTVAQEAVAAAGVPQDGVAGMARAMAPKTDIAQNTGVMSQAPQAPPQAPPAPDQGGIMGMANGGYVKKMGLGGSVDPRPTMGSGRNAFQAIKEWDRLYGQTHNPDGTPKNTSPNIAPGGWIKPKPNMGSGRNAFQAIKEWNQLYGETHNPDGSPKGVENPMKPPKDYQPMGVPPREVPTMDQDPSQVIDEMIKCNKGYILNKVNPKDSKTWVCIPDPNYKPEGDDPVAPTVTSGGGAGSSNEYLNALKDMMADNEKSAKQDKWMALAQMGLGLMQGGSGSFLGDVGAAGLPAIQSYKDSRDSASKRKLGLLGAVEDSRLADARIAASASRASSAGSPKSGDIDKYVDNLSKQIANIDKKLEDTMGLLSEEEKKELLRQRSEYQFLYNQALTNQGALYGNFTDVTE
jgi:hypothetical protein